MTDLDLQDLMLTISATRAQLEGALTQLKRVEIRLARAGGNVPSTPVPKASPELPVGEPRAELLSGLDCPRCGGQLRWRYSRTNGQWFAGCTNFRNDRGPGSCSGSRNLQSVMQLNEERNAAQQGGPTSEEPPDMPEPPPIDEESGHGDIPF